MSTPDIPLHTDAEIKAIEMAGRLFALIRDEVIGHGPNREQDIRELASWIHVIQDKVKAQASGRAYPHKHRLLGETLPARKENVLLDP
jgi:hypothetical protein